MLRIVFLGGTLLLPVLARAQTSALDRFVPLIGIPGLEPNAYNFELYINTLYILAISIAAFLAVGRLMWAGLQYILSDVVTKKEQAKKDIRNAFLGLGIVIGAILILQTINPNLTNFGALENIRPVTTTTQSPRVETVVTSVPGSNVDTIENVGRISPGTRNEFIQNCRQGGGTYVVVGMSGRCLGNESSAANNNTFNTQERLTELTTNLNLTGSVRDEFIRDYNQFIGTQEPRDLTSGTVTELQTLLGADEVVFVVTHTQNINRETSGIQTQQISLCQQITGADNFVIEGNYGVCVR